MRDVPVPFPPLAAIDSQPGRAEPAGEPPVLEQLEEERPFDLWRIPPGGFPWLTLAVLLLSAGIFAASHLAAEQTFAVFYASGFEVWTDWKKWGALIGTNFIHGDTLHLVFNSYWIWIFGRLLEPELGRLRYAGLFLAGAWLSSIAELAWSGQPGIGLSGIVYAFFGFMLINRRERPAFAAVLPFGTVQLLLGWFVICFPLTYLGVLQVANFGHLGGLVAGCLAGLAARPHPWQKSARAAGVAVGVLSLLPLLWAPWQENWFLARAYRALQQQEGDEQVLAAFEKARAKNPANVWAVENECALWIKRGQYAAARDALDRALQSSEDARLRNVLAWLLATCPVDEIRDGARAKVLAQRACESDGWKTAAFIDTLAAACAETGDFQEAEKWMLKALAGNPGHDASEMREHLVAFRAGKPWREPPVAKAP